MEKRYLNSVQANDSAQISDYFRVVKRRKSTLFSCVVVFVLIALVHTFNTTPVYHAQTQLLIERNNPQLVSVPEVSSLDGQKDDFYKTRYELLRDRSLAKKVIKKLNLNKHGEFRKGSSRLSLHRIKKKLNLMLVQAGIRDKTPQKEKEKTYSQAQVIDSFLSKLTINPVPDSRLVNVGFQGYDPELITWITNTHAQMYIQKTIELRSNLERGASHWLQEKADHQKVQVKELERKLQKIKEEKNIIELEEKMKIATQKLKSIDTKVENETRERIRLETNRNLFKQMKDKPLELFEVLPNSLKSDVSRKLYAHYLNLKREYDEKSERYSPEYPSMVSLQFKIKGVEARIPKEIDRLFKALEVQYKTAVAQEASSKKMLKKQKRIVMDLEKESSEYNLVKNELNSSRKMLATLINRLKEVDVTAGSTESNIKIVFPADVPGSPIKPNKKRNLVVGLFGGLFFGFALIFFMESLDKVIRNIDQVKSQLDLPVLGVISLFKKNETQFPVVKSPDSPYAEEFRVVRTSMMYNFSDSPQKVLMFTSTTAGEGKTLVSCNLAAAFAQMGKRVLIVDADLRRARTHKFFSSNRKRGLVEHLNGIYGLDEVLQETPVQGLCILPGGDITAYQPSGVLGSRKFQKLLVTLKKEFDLVLVDSPPILHIADAGILASHCDGVIFIIEAGAHDKKMIQRALSQLPEFKSHDNENPEKARQPVKAVFPVNKTIGRELQAKSQTPVSSPEFVGAILNKFDYREEEHYGYYSKYGKYGKYLEGYFNFKEKKKKRERVSA